jgi:hypothetical protein
MVDTRVLMVASTTHASFLRLLVDADDESLAPAKPCEVTMPQSLRPINRISEDSFGLSTTLPVFAQKNHRTQFSEFDKEVHIPEMIW